MNTKFTALQSNEIGTLEKWNLALKKLFCFMFITAAHALTPKAPVALAERRARGGGCGRGGGEEQVARAHTARTPISRLGMKGRVLTFRRDQRIR